MGSSAQEKVSVLRAAIAQWVKLYTAVIFKLKPSLFLAVQPSILLRALHVLQRDN